MQSSTSAKGSENPLIMTVGTPNDQDNQDRPLPMPINSSDLSISSITDSILPLGCKTTPFGAILPI